MSSSAPGVQGQGDSDCDDSADDQHQHAQAARQALALLHVALGLHQLCGALYHSIPGPANLHGQGVGSTLSSHHRHWVQPVPMYLLKGQPAWVPLEILLSPADSVQGGSQYAVNCQSGRDTPQFSEEHCAQNTGMTLIL